MATKPAPRSARPSVGEGDVGQRLRAYREQRELSLRELARRLGISPSAISQIETGKSRPSVSTLYAIVSELGMSLDELFSGQAPSQRADGRKGASPEKNKPARETRAGATVASPPAAQPAPEEGRHVQRSGSRRAIELESGVRWERLTPHPDPGADFLYVVYDVGGSSSQNDRFIRHTGHEYGLVLSGQLEVTVGFDAYVLGPGDSISFDSTVPHCLRNVGTEPVHGVWFVIGRQSDERALAFGAE